MKRLRCVALMLASYLLALGSQVQPMQPAVPTSTLATSARPAQTVPHRTSLQSQILAYQERLHGLSAEAAAADWLHLFDQVPTSPMQKATDDPLREVLLALPPPSHWPALDRAIEARPKPEGRAARRDLALRLLAKVLTGDTAGQNAVARELKALGDHELTELDSPEHFDTIISNNIELDAWMQPLENPVDPVAEFEHQLNDKPKYRVIMPFDAPRLETPDLVTLVGQERATTLLLRALTESRHAIQPSAGEETLRLSRQLALDHLHQLKIPQWALVDPAEPHLLIEAFEKQFPAPSHYTRGTINTTSFDSEQSDGTETGDDMERSYQICTFYLHALVREQRYDDAVAVLNTVNNDVHHASGLAEALAVEDPVKSYQFLRQVIRKLFHVAYLPSFCETANRAGKSADAADLLRNKLKQEIHYGQDPIHLRAALAIAELNAEQWDAGLATCRELVALPRRTQSQFAATLHLHNIGQRLGRKDLIDPAVEFLAELLARPLDKQDHRLVGLREGAEFQIDWFNEVLPPVSGDRKAIRALVESGRGETAIRWLQQELQQMAAAHQLQSTEEQDLTEHAQPLLIDLLSIHHQLGQYQQVVHMLDTGIYWNARDARDLLWETDFRDHALAEPIITALAATGKIEQARLLCEAWAWDHGDDDAAYAMLVRLTPDPQLVIRKLNALAVANPLEPRPLIWKAEVLRAASRLNEAEATARRAVALAPADANQRGDHRMRAQAVLATILAAQGNDDEARQFQQLVESVHMAESAAALEQHDPQGAINRYQKALQIHAGDYLTHWNLARCLTDAGQSDAAQPHLRKAFELMVTGVDRAGPYCRTIQRTFKSDTSITLADQIFTAAIQQQPANPRAHYLLGVVREEQGRTLAALALYTEATRLDPDFLDAWYGIDHLPANAVPPSLRDDAQLAMHRLRPLGINCCSDGLDTVKDLGKLWDLATSIPKNPIPMKIYPLQASANNRLSFRARHFLSTRIDLERTVHAGSSRLLNHPAIRHLIDLMGE